MIIINNTEGRIEDYVESNDGVVLFGNKKVDINVLKDSPTLNKVGKKIATAKLVKLVPKEKDFLYIRNRAVSAGNVIEREDGTCDLVPIDEFHNNFGKYAFICRGANDNGDFFSHEELEKKYKTFIGKAVFYEHDDDNINKARGIILDSIYNTNGYYVELFEAIDAKAYPQLATAVKKGHLTDTSMGCYIGKAMCSICGNISTEANEDDPEHDDRCEHIKRYKGLTYNGLPVFEDNRDVVFFEDSIVGTGADSQAKIMERVASKKNKSGIILPQYYQKKNDVLAKEQNQRTFQGRVHNLENKFNELPWS